SVSSEILYIYLDTVPDCREIISKLPDRATSNKDNEGGGDYVDLDNDGQLDVALIEVIDAWGNPIWYRWQGFGNFPELISAGPDGIFGNADDIRSTEL
ncbi:MAG: hypothetical protein JW860_10170, partial [Sedimentisphaerales bacterium]|nr:hypothetical protein [Sedimentisphaerales bacterium]